MLFVMNMRQILRGSSLKNASRVYTTITSAFDNTFRFPSTLTWREASDVLTPIFKVLAHPRTFRRSNVGGFLIHCSTNSCRLSSHARLT